MNRTPRRTALVGLAAAISAGACAPPDGGSAAGDAWGGVLETGPYDVGFDTRTLTRPVQGGSLDQTVRHLTLAVWYPAEPGPDDPAVTVEDLFHIVLAQEQLDEPDGLSVERGFVAAMTGDSMAIPRGRAREALDAPTFAYADAPPASGRFPIALWGVRHATVLAQAPLAEVLASHGMVVASVWSSDPPLAFSWEDRPESEKQETVAAQAADLEHALATLLVDPSVDPDRVISLAWSYGGPTAALLSDLTDPLVTIGLDADVLPAGRSTPIRLDNPLVWLARADAAVPDLAIGSEQTSSWITVHLPELEHGNFNALEGLLPSVYGAETVFSWSRPGPIGAAGYAAIVRIVTEVAREYAGDTLRSVPEIADAIQSVAVEVAVELRSGG